jgi:hypothetical protein
VDLGRAYALLEVRTGAGGAEVHAAYRRLAWRWHPDRWQSDPARARRGTDELAQINAAYAAIRRAGFPAAVSGWRPVDPAPASVRASAVGCPPPVSPRPHPRAPSPAPAPTARPHSAGTDEDGESVLWALVWLVLALITLGALADIAELGEHGDD